jgi:membrane fusion protein (multidrug efflux system)
VVVQGDDSFVYRIKGDTVERVSIATGARQGDLVEITGGLKAGDRIVADGTHRVTPGGKVKIVEIDGKPIETPQRKPES